MTITLKLSAEEQARLEAVAEAANVSVERVLHGLIAQLSVPVSAEAPEERREEPDAAEEQQREQEEVEANIKRWHQERAQT